MTEKQVKNLTFPLLESSAALAAVVSVTAGPEGSVSVTGWPARELLPPVGTSFPRHHLRSSFCCWPPSGVRKDDAVNLF